MKRFLLLFAVLCVCELSFGQDGYVITLVREKIDIPNRLFYINSVVDNRVKKNAIGIVRMGAFNGESLAQLNNGLTNSLMEYFGYAIPRGADKLPVTIYVNKLEISEEAKVNAEYGYADVLLEYYNGNKLLFSSTQHIEMSSSDVTRFHEENIRIALKKSIVDFSNSGWLAKYTGNASDAVASVGRPDTAGAITAASLVASNLVPEDLTPAVLTPAVLTPAILTPATLTSDSEYKTSNKAEDVRKNVMTVGYQIAGFSLIGFDYEIKLDNYIGVHFGGGLSGYTYGAMVHTNPRPNSPFFNLSFKDGGFGLLKVIGLEYGAKWVLNKKTGFGLLAQVGLGRIIEIDNDFAASIAKDGKVAKMTGTLGIGFSW